MRVWLLPLIALMACLGTPAEATPPKAPSGLTLTSTLNPAQLNTFGNGTGRYYWLKWNDNSLDETGFKIQYRAGGVGSFYYLDAVPANTKQYIVPLNFGENVYAQFQIVAFKYNGTAVESSYSNIVQEVATLAAGTLNAPTEFKAFEVNDGQLRFTWSENGSTSEVFFQVFYKKTTEATAAFKKLGPAQLFNTTEAVIQHGLIPGVSYNFAIRATRNADESFSTSPLANANDSLLVETVVYPVKSPVRNYYEVPALKIPTGLGGAAVDSERVRLTWNDNNDNETYYEMRYKKPSASTWDADDVLQLSPNTTSFTITVGPGGTYEWQIRAVYQEDEDATPLRTDYSDSHTIVMPFIAPTGLTATTSGISGAIDLTWQDTSVSEANYTILSRVHDEDEDDEDDDWFFVHELLPDSTRATVSTFENSGGQTVSFSKDTDYEFIVIARYGNQESEPTNIARAIPRHGFTSRPYHPAKVGVPFTYTMAVSNSTDRSSWNVTGLPDGLIFNADTGVISGTPEQTGVFTCPMTVSYTTSTAGPALPLTLRVLRADASPTVVESARIPSLSIGTGTQFEIPLEGKFADADTEMAVKLQTTRGDIDMLLYPSLTPQAVNNFMGYVNSGAYNGVIFHRSVPDFIVQGGAYVPIQEPNYFSSLIKRPASRNEPGISNLRGTVAHAKVGDNPDSATHDFFFNLEDNSLKSGIELDNQNSGFTVFARVGNNSLPVVDGIADLPIGVYTNTSSSGGADNRVILDNAYAEFPAVPMDVTGTTAPAAMNVNRTVRILNVQTTSGFKYEVSVADNTAPAVLRATINEGKLRLEGLVPGSKTVTLKALDLDGNAVEQSFNVNVVRGLKPPVITRQPASVAAILGKKASLTVTATGTSLTYQWMKKIDDEWTEVPDSVTGAKAKTLSFAAVAPNDLAEYRVVITNPTQSVVSVSAKLEEREIPVVTENPEGMVVNLGEALELEAAVTGVPVPTLTWLRSGKTVSGQKVATLNIPEAKLTDAGSYVMRASNAAGKDESAAADVIVVDKTSRMTLSLPEKTVVLKAQVSGPPGLLYQWRAGGEDISDDGVHYFGTGSPTLTIKKIALVHGATYTCRVTTSDETMEAETGPWAVRLTQQRPTLATFTPDAAYVGIEYDYTLPGGGSGNTTISSFAVTGLPAGLKLDAVNGRITGKASRPGEYKLKVTASNPAGSTSTGTSNISLFVYPMPEAVVGTFVGQIGASVALNGNMGGRVDMTVTENGLISGKLTQGKEVLSFKGQMSQDPSSISTSGEATVIRKGKTPLEITLTSLSPSGYTDSGNVSGIISDGLNFVRFSAYRSIYNAQGRLSPYVGRQHLALTLQSEFANNAAVPQGAGYAVASLDLLGNARVAGRLSDGTTLTSSSFLGGQQQFLIYQSLYKHSGSFVGQAALIYIDTVGPATQRVNRFRSYGEFAWVKNPQTSGLTRTYDAGFGPVYLDTLGMTYTTPTGGALIMDLPKISGNAGIDFVGAGVEASSTNPDVTRLHVGGTKLIPTGVVNSAGLSLNIDSTNGLFSGSFNLTDPGPNKRPSKFYGVIIPKIPNILNEDGTAVAIAGEKAFGVGHFLLGQLPSAGPPATTLKTAPILSGRVDLKPVPIYITDQPDSQTVDPNTNVTFSVAASSATGTVLSYQWRKNGTNITTGGTSSTYSLTNVQAAAEGNYDVVITASITTTGSNPVTTQYSSVVSDPAKLTLNLPISNVTLARSPTTSPVPIGTKVVFTASSKGSSPKSYQWYKDNQPIEVADTTSPTLTLDSLTLADRGTYTVKVSNLIGPEGGVLSGGNSLEVSGPITQVSTSRTPSSGLIAIGGNIEFKVTNIVGGAGNYIYQWYKGDDLLDGKTDSSYKIDFVNVQDAGTYSVLVKDSLTPDGVESEGISFEVSTAVSNVIASRTPFSNTVPLNSQVVFTVSSKGASPFTYQWMKNGEIIEGATAIDYVINQVTEEKVGTYTVLVSNNYNNTPTSSLSNEVSLAIQLPVTTVTLSVTDNELSIPVGGGTTLTATPNSTDPYYYRWYKNGSELTEYENQSNITLTNVTTDDAGEYRVEARNAANPEGVYVPSDTVFIDVVTEP